MNPDRQRGGTVSISPVSELFGLLGTLVGGLSGQSAPKGYDVAKGGHARSGPPPDPNALRRDRDHAEWVDLPAAGRVGDPPVWPLPDVLSGELEAWAREWRRPQAVVWERNSQELEVALFVRAVSVAEGPKASAADRNVVQRKMCDLGLTVPGLRANRWRIVDEAAVSKPARGRGGRPSARSRMKLVKDA